MSEDTAYNSWLKQWMHTGRLSMEFPSYAGPLDSPVAIVGQKESNVMIPFGSKRGTEFAYNALGDTALKIGWTYATIIKPQGLRNKRGIIVCGTNAAKWLQYYVGEGGMSVLKLPVPKYFLTRYSDADIQTVYKLVRSFVENHTNKERIM